MSAAKQLRRRGCREADFDVEPALGGAGVVMVAL